MAAGFFNCNPTVTPASFSIWVKHSDRKSWGSGFLNGSVSLVIPKDPSTGLVLATTLYFASGAPNPSRDRCYT